MKKLFTWFWLLCKRLYKKPVFLVLLALIPLLSWGYSLTAQQDSGMITILLAQEGSEPFTDNLFTDLQESTQLVNFQVCDTPEEARLLLQSGKADAAWLFPADILSHLEAYAQSPTKANAFITVLEREDNVALMLTREKLSGAIFREVSQRVYLQFMRENTPELSHLSDEELLAYSENAVITGDLFVFTSTAGTQTPSTHYLLTPLRGLLGVLALLCALACGMYHIRDEEAGTFAWVRYPWRWVPELAGQVICTGHITLVCFICLALCGLTGAIWAELLAILLYSLCCGLFAMLLRRLCGSVRVMGALLPLLTVAALVVCPVFFEVRATRLIQHILPPSYFIHAGSNPVYLGYMLLYGGILAGLCLLWERLPKRRS